MAHEAKLLESVDREILGQLADKIAERGDWYEALVYAALDDTQDLAEAVKLADEVYAEQSTDPSDPNDYRGLLDEE